MPLSDEEQRLLEQMERALVEEDPKFASTLRGTRFARATRARLILASVVFVGGVVVLMSGVVLQASMPVQALLGVIGFVVMLASATVGLSAWQRRQSSSDQQDRRAVGGEAASGLSVIQGGKSARKPKPGKASKAPKSSGSFMQRIEERWQRRRGENGF